MIIKLLDRLPIAQRQIIGFVLVGGLTTGVNLGIAFSMTFLLATDTRLSNAVGYWSGVVLGYFLNRTITFQATDQSHIKHLIPYLGLYFMSYLAGLLVVEFVHVDQPLWKAVVLVAATVASTICNFIGTKFLVFKK